MISRAAITVGGINTHRSGIEGGRAADTQRTQFGGGPYRIVEHRVASNNQALRTRRGGIDSVVKGDGTGGQGLGRVRRIIRSECDGVAVALACPAALDRAGIDGDAAGTGHIERVQTRQAVRSHAIAQIDCRRRADGQGLAVTGQPTVQGNRAGTTGC